MLVQETKTTKAKRKEFERLADKICDDEFRHQYHQLTRYWSHSVKGGYAGTAIFSNRKALNITYGVGDKHVDEEGRYVILEFKEYFLVCVYGIRVGINNPSRLDVKRNHHKRMMSHFKKLSLLKPLVIGGDLNVVHLNSDLRKEKPDSATEAEREDFAELLAECGLVDTCTST